MKLFITGTDTHVGKTYVAVALTRYFNQLGFKTIAIKPLASGAIFVGDELKSEDAILLRAVSSKQLPYILHNPVTFSEPTAPHIAATRHKYPLGTKALSRYTNRTFLNKADIYIIEGVGGWHVPLNEKETMGDFVVQMKLDVLLVVPIKLGCINHAILTQQAIYHSGANCIGWIANQCEAPNDTTQEIITTLHDWLKAPCVGKIEYKGKADFAFPALNIIPGK